MSLLHRIPPMVSALAFGYGVGMAAPESTLRTVHTAVAGPADSPSFGVAAAPPLAPRSAAARAPDPVGDESRELSRLRFLKEGESKRGESCDLERPNHSRPPRYESRRDAYADD